MEIIPAIDLIDGKCVRLLQGDYSKKTIYNENPLEVAKMFEAAGIRRLHLVDLDGAKAKHIVNQKILETISTKTNLIIDFGGGLKSDKDLEIAFNSGAQMITGGSIAVKEQDTFLIWLEKYGSEKIILGADAKDGNIAVGGWLETTSLPVIEFISEFHKKGISKVISTDISRDGMLSGPSFELYVEILKTLPNIEIIASGGIATMADILKLDEMGVPGVITGKAIYENRITLNEIEGFIV
ncbi:MAG: 1-(5-phosphoribosyl)-5-[(5-phosphoribosylamino)methylideneamino]imidazole-4-carboxamide isomerase [Prolixibacteraceae bacterium]|nr:1-(5-phosphoribosyl)-5-[(5-phosphoribosylamino)methylideneamino]imidazole-4-carboxamide isomerase [Prolixibacteraceae bacterium]MBT6764151.1 1-(5-phosphoribosyl)-5-[(5-phosphoribosylamino)methylideneamino]imidazole-4-carboxamide isomerase [Prolixibacteraceae bacterium]MBT6998622.1 1-(5-phosphoribosyl)-5-[(5-phosphoribosylamino)methylideneamino]imidazole-4-carboxamide isomerase [Prolixibacteraceae bacterium]MBT7397423.1 1-(5-phosphoribosyl)-5-[(5-phosphoribosylamino)methylideneamino]imidazole-